MSKPGNTELAEHFDRLLDLYLERKATDDQKNELRSLADQFGDRFQSKFDTVISSELVGEEMSEQTRQEILTNILSREHVRENKSRTIIWRWVATAATVAILCTVSLWLYNHSNLSEVEGLTSNEQPVQEEKYYSGRQFVKLTDGSGVLMSDNAKLRVLRDFNNQVRDVTLEGKAYFDIAHNPDKPFRVITGEVITTVLGTAFNIDATLTEVEVTVSRGKVQVGDKDHVYGLLTRDQQIKVNVETKQVISNAAKAEEVTAWKRDYLIFDNLSMDAAATMIFDKYNVRITYSNENIRNCSAINATFLSGESLDQVLEVISTVVHVKYKMLPDGNVLFEGEGCPASP